MEDQRPVAEVPIGFFEYHAIFEEPIFAAWFGKDAARGTLTTGMYKILTPWGIDLSKITVNLNPKNMQEIQTSFTTSNPPALINLGMGGVAFIVQNAEWSKAPMLVSMFQTVLNHLKTTVPTELGSQQTILGFHVKPGPKPWREVMQRFVNAKALGVEEDASTYGVGAYGVKFSVLLDNSLALPGGLFVKITRVFPAETHFEEMSSILWKDEEGMLGRLGFRTQ